MTGVTGRLLRYAEGSPASNMAVDQWMLQTVDEGGPPSLRFYGWTEPTLSLGYFQPVTDRRRHAPSQPIACVRRSTGGGAIVHHHELTYSFAVPLNDKRSGAREDLYRLSHQAVIDVLAGFGVQARPYRLCGEDAEGVETDHRPEPFLCFQRRTDEDLIVSGYKVLGSAQRRGRRALLQHGSLLLRASRAAPQLPGVFELTSRDLELGRLIDALAQTFAGVLGVKDWHSGAPDDAQWGQIRKVERSRFGDPQWLNRR